MMSSTWHSFLIAIGWERQPQATRFVHANDETLNTAAGFPSNRITNTKYTPLTFVPKNLAAQCSQHMNRYFLLIACLQLFPTITPVNPITTWGPLLLIFSITAIKEGVDDYHRYQADKQANQRLVAVLRGGVLTKIQSQEIHCGDIVQVTEGHEFPCDMVLLTSSDPSGLCYIQTSNIDGETNLKQRTALAETASMTQDELSEFKGVVECAAPDNSIYHFDSTLRMRRGNEDVTLALTTEQLLLQATYLRNTKWVYGLCVYTGNETKVGQNKTQPRQKWTALDRLINQTTIGVFIFQVCVIVILGALGNQKKDSDGNHMWYLHYEYDEKRWYNGLIIPLRFLLLSSLMIPISLKVSMDLAKLFYSLLIDWDLHMYDAKRDTPAHASNTAISEDLGQVEYILSDKTGTLTENEMILRCCSIGDERYGDHSDTLSHDSTLLERARMGDDSVVTLLRHMSLCNTVVPKIRDDESGIQSKEESQSDVRTGVKQRTRRRRSFRPGVEMTKDESTADLRDLSLEDDGQDSDDQKYPDDITNVDIEYASSSPDEFSLVTCAHTLGVSLVHRDKTDVTIRMHGKVEKYHLLQTLEFSSNRKRMSVVLRHSTTHEITLFTKGADDVMLVRLAHDPSNDESMIREILDGYSQKGLRTLVMAQRQVSEEEYAAWYPKWERANVDIHHRERQLHAVYEELETNLYVVGITGIEDKLQEGVEQTIATLREAGIRVWMLTGDKQQTAVEISRSCNLIAPTDQVFIIAGRAEAEVQQAIERATNALNVDDANLRPYAIVVDGAALNICLHRYEKEFADVSAKAVSVVCCRVTPSQKAAVVSLVKKLGKVTLAIGDGGNDVSMIQEADVGVGISGREGLQAARAADYSLSRFSYLVRLLFIHGRYSYIRTAFIAQYCFYKSLFICFLQLMFSTVSLYSGASYLDSFSLVTYNMFYTSFPVLFYCLEKDVSESTLLAHPRLYETSHGGTLFTKWTFAQWFTRALWQAGICAAFAFGCVHGSTRNAFGENGQASSALVMYSAAVLVQTTMMAMETTYFTKYNFGALGLTLFLFLILNLILAAMPFVLIYRIYFTLLGDGEYWLRILCITVACTVPVFAVKYVQHEYFPTVTQLARRHDIAMGKSARNDRYGALSSQPQAYVPLGNRDSISYDTHPHSHAHTRSSSISHGQMQSNIDVVQQHTYQQDGQHDQQTWDGESTPARKSTLRVSSGSGSRQDSLTADEPPSPTPSTPTRNVTRAISRLTA